MSNGCSCLNFAYLDSLHAKLFPFTTGEASKVQITATIAQQQFQVHRKNTRCELRVP